MEATTELFLEKSALRIAMKASGMYQGRKEISAHGAGFSLHRWWQRAAGLSQRCEPVGRKGRLGHDQHGSSHPDLVGPTLRGSAKESSRVGDPPVEERRLYAAAAQSVKPNPWWFR